MKGLMRECVHAFDGVCDGLLSQFKALATFSFETLGNFGT